MNNIDTNLNSIIIKHRLKTNSNLIIRQII